MSSVIQLKDLANVFGTSKRGDEYFLKTDLPRTIPFRIDPSPGAKNLIVTFHGAANRQKRTYPVFGPFVRGVDESAHQIAIADTSLDLSDELTISWFAGSSDMPLQEVILSFLEALKEQLDIEKLIFVGGSGGGYAALYYSWHFPGSVVVAFSPQTILGNYSKSLTERYFNVAWGGSLPGIKNGPTVDLRELYGDRVSNHVVYLQSQGDRVHLFRHMVPFLGSITNENQHRILSRVSYWGKAGHSGSVPRSEVARYVRAVISSRAIDADEIQDEYDRHVEAAATLSDNRQRRSNSKTSSDNLQEQKQAQRHQLADRIARETLRK